MRSSKSRSRNKNNNNNRNRNQSSNNLNRVFDSTGPEGKVRGTPQQIIEKYSQLARDATLGDDRVAAENFMQHSEHYTRVFAEAQREMDTKREAQEKEHRERQQARADRQQHQGQGQNAQGDQQQGQQQNQPQQSQPQQSQPQQNDQQQNSQPQINQQPVPDLGSAEQPDIAPPMAQDADSGLVATPEQTSEQAAVSKPRTRKPRSRPVSDDGGDQPETSKAAE